MRSLGEKCRHSQLTVSGTVIDSNLDRVEINGTLADILGEIFTIDEIPLNLGTNTITATAFDIAGNFSACSITVTLRGNTSPTITNVLPELHGIFAEGETVELSIEAEDVDGDSLEYKISIGSTTIKDWDSAESYSWTISTATVGSHTITFEVRDAYAGTASFTRDVYICRSSIEPPQLP